MHLSYAWIAQGGTLCCREADALLASAGRLLARPAQLPPGLMATTRMRDANIAEPSKAVVQSIEFHPQGQVLMTAGMDKRLRFFQACLTTAVVHWTVNA